MIDDTRKSSEWSGVVREGGAHRSAERYDPSTGQALIVRPLNQYPDGCPVYTTKDTPWQERYFTEVKGRSQDGILKLGRLWEGLKAFNPQEPLSAKAKDAQHRVSSDRRKRENKAAASASGSAGKTRAKRKAPRKRNSISIDTTAT